ncbi:MAG: ribonuclease III [Alphaproteobacteria bacterium]|nr:ribonuclease III [Alphaproteobacteria bacterium]
MGDPIFPHIRLDKLVSLDAFSLDDLAATLGHQFERPFILREALCHPSAMASADGSIHGYERLEFLGDRVLGLVMADLLFHSFPDEDEGALSRRFVALVRRESLVRVAEAIDLGNYVILSAGEADSGGRGSPAVLADSCEAVIAALYLDGGLDVARRFIERFWTPLMDENETPPMDAKTALQEWAQGRGKPLPVYETVAAEGPAHEPEFTIEVTVKGHGPARAKGPSKRAAEQAAAAALLKAIEMASRE